LTIYTSIPECLEALVAEVSDGALMDIAPTLAAPPSRIRDQGTPDTGSSVA
jgi:hypothetical protein